ncbi:unnamed protein product [Somion occarium]|uniref:Uncharacterized protein n=1 Tax=Somion occarium TaxID=3059160 RepID=A0ABP1CKE1_9APHY
MTSLEVVTQGSLNELELPHGPGFRPRDHAETVISGLEWRKRVYKAPMRCILFIPPFVTINQIIMPAGSVWQCTAGNATQTSGTCATYPNCTCGEQNKESK